MIKKNVNIYGGMKVDKFREIAHRQGVHREDIMTPAQRADYIGAQIMHNEGDAVKRYLQKLKK